MKVRTGTKSRNDWNESITQVGLELVRLTPRLEGKEGGGNTLSGLNGSGWRPKRKGQGKAALLNAYFSTTSHSAQSKLTIRLIII